LAVVADKPITQLLAEWGDGDSKALDQLAPLVYGELRRMAARHLRSERAGHTLQTTGLVHEAFLRLIGETGVRWQGRSHFFALASRLMRRILVDVARARLAAKRGSGQAHVSLDELADAVEDEGADFFVEQALGAGAQTSHADLMAIDAALTRLEALDARQAQIVELRFFGGLTVEETAHTLDISNATVKRDWVMAKAWLARELAGTERP
jgi:RNA polymerase sigma factor (TIGR02999 family)